MRALILDTPDIAPIWKGEVCEVLRWVHDDMYIVKVGDTELFLHSSEFIQIAEKEVNHGIHI